MRVVIAGCDFHGVHADELQALETAQDFQKFVASRTARDRGPGAWCEGRVEAIDVAGNIHRSIAEPLAEPVNGLRHGRVIVPGCGIHRQSRVPKLLPAGRVKSGPPPVTS
jgi:hypothetical protein